MALGQGNDANVFEQVISAALDGCMAGPLPGIA